MSISAPQTGNCRMVEFGSGEATGIGAGIEREFAADDGRFSDVSSAN